MFAIRTTPPELSVPSFPTRDCVAAILPGQDAISNFQFQKDKELIYVLLFAGKNCQFPASSFCMIDGAAQPLLMLPNSLSGQLS
jgi:hypothetical protein